MLAHDLPDDLRMRERLDEIIFLLRFLLRPADHREQAGHDEQICPAAAIAGQAGLDVRIKGLRILQIEIGGEDHLSCAGGEIAPVFRSARLDNHRIALRRAGRSEEHTSELQSLMRISYAVFCLKKKQQTRSKH